MGLFEFIIIIVLIASGTEMITKIGVALTRQLGNRRRPADEPPPVPAGAVRSEALEEIEERLARIEDRLDFLEELKAPPERPRLTAASRFGNAREPGPDDN
jgi:hypothetical protein